MASVVFEVGGLGTLAWQLGRVQRREFGAPAWMLRVRGCWRRLTGQLTSVSSSLDIRYTVESSTAGEVSVRKRTGSDATLESRIAALEANQFAIDEETAARFERVDRGQNQLQRHVDALGEELRGQHDQREQERREQLRESMALQ